MITKSDAETLFHLRLS